MDRTNPFDIQWEKDHAAESVEEEAKGKLEEDRESARERNKRLVALGNAFFYDPKERAILQKEGSQFKFLSHERRRVARTPEGVRVHALENGFKAVSGGFYWNLKTKHLYVRQGERYVLYALDRRKARAGKAAPKRRQSDRSRRSSGSKRTS